MRRQKDKFVLFVIISVVILLVISLICIFTAKCMETNTASMIGGALSAVATMLLGVIAYWQNKRYKKLADEMNDLVYMPEICKAETLRDKLDAKSKANYNSFSFKVNTTKSTAGIDCGDFLVLNAPILNLHVVSISKGKVILNLNGDKKALYSKESGFCLHLVVPEDFKKGDNTFQIVFEYENLYGNHYEKHGTFDLNNNAEYAMNWKLERARRK